MKKEKNAVSYELEPKDASVHIRISEGLLDAVKSRAKKLKVNYQKVIRKAIEDFINKKC